MLDSLAIKRAAARVKEVKEDVILLMMRRDPDLCLFCVSNHHANRRSVPDDGFLNRIYFYFVSMFTCNF